MQRRNLKQQRFLAAWSKPPALAKVRVALANIHMMIDVGRKTYDIK